MQQFAWREAYSVDIPQLDAQHRQIIELLDELGRIAHGGENDKLIAAALEKVTRYAHWHLRREELVLRVRSYPGYEEHKAEHEAYREKVTFLQANSHRRDLGIRMTNFLNQWWRHHILTSDQQYARFFRRQSGQ
ncbi:MAG: bacteriohemerythrin [Acidobacteriia bacterium]|nr:bacteriohemerythrin [Terriglobia bacterium]